MKTSSEAASGRRLTTARAALFLHDPERPAACSSCLRGLPGTSHICTVHQAAQRGGARLDGAAGAQVQAQLQEVRVPSPHHVHSIAPMHIVVYPGRRPSAAPGRRGWRTAAAPAARPSPWSPMAASPSASTPFVTSSRCLTAPHCSCCYRFALDQFWRRRIPSTPDRFQLAV